MTLPIVLSVSQAINYIAIKTSHEGSQFPLLQKQQSNIEMLNSKTF